MYPFQLAISPTAIKIYLTTTLFLATSFVLLSTSTTAFGLFYYNFIPQTDLERPIYLQYAADAYPSAVVPLKTNALISQQPYDVSIVLHMPRDPVNLGLGNFMLDLSLHGNTENLESTVLKTLKLEDQVPSPTLHRSRRSAILPYASPVNDLVSKALHLPLHVLSLRDTDSVTLTIPMFEEVEFGRGKNNIPTTARLTIETQRPTQSLVTSQLNTVAPPSQLHVYSAKLIFHIRFHGLRYLIYNYRIPALMIFSTLFYVVSISTLVAVWAVVATLLRKPEEQSLVKTEKDKIKKEPGAETTDGLKSATDYKSDKTPKLEDASENETVNPRDTWTAPGRDTELTPQTSEPASAASQDQVAVAQGTGAPPEEHADDEDEESDDEWQQLQKLRKRMEDDARQRQLQMQQHDSGLGTSMESENATAVREGLNKRSNSRRGSGKE